MSSRRSFIAFLMSGLTMASGCLDYSPVSQSQKLRSVTTRDSIFVDNHNAGSDEPFKAEIFSTPEEATDSLDTSIPAVNALENDVLDFDSSSEFLAVFSSTLAFTQPESLKGWCPQREINGDQFIFHLPLKEWPSELSEPYQNIAVLNLWNRRLSPPPTHATVNISLVGEENNIQTCSSSIDTVQN